MNKILLSISLACCVNLSWSQEFSSRTWHEGWLVTIKGDTIRGELKYDMESNSIQILNEQKKVATLSSKKIMYVEFFDNLLKTYRKFYAIPYNVHNDFRAPILFEIQYEGPVSLLSREKIVAESDPYSQSYFYATNSNGFLRERVVFTYYFAFKTGEVVMYTGKKGELFSILNDHSDKLKDFVKKNRLNTNEIRDLVRIVAYYNSF